MKLWVLLTIFGQPVGSWGPLAMSMNTCIERAAAVGVNIANDFDNRKLEGKIHLGGRIVHRGDFQLKCVWADRRPELGGVK